MDRGPRSDARREELIDKLVTTSHLNVPERAELNPRTVSRCEVAHVIRGILEQSRFFPTHARPVRSQTEVTDAIYDGMIVEKADGAFVVHAQLSGPHPFAFRGHVEKSFSRIDDALDYFIGHEYRGDIDGVRIAD